MLRDRNPINPDLRLVVDCAEAEEEAVPCCAVALGADVLDASLVPDDFVGFLEVYSRGGGLEGVGDGDFGGLRWEACGGPVLGEAGVGVVEGEGPGPVEGGPG